MSFFSDNSFLGSDFQAYEGFNEDISKSNRNLDKTSSQLGQASLSSTLAPNYEQVSHVSTNDNGWGPPASSPFSDRFSVEEPTWEDYTEEPSTPLSVLNSHIGSHIEKKQANTKDGEGSVLGLRFTNLQTNYYSGSEIGTNITFLTEQNAQFTTFTKTPIHILKLTNSFTIIDVLSVLDSGLIELRISPNLDGCVFRKAPNKSDIYRCNTQHGHALARLSEFKSGKATFTLSDMISISIKIPYTPDKPNAAIVLHREEDTSCYDYASSVVHPHKRQGDASIRSTAEYRHRERSHKQYNRRAAEDYSYISRTAEWTPPITEETTLIDKLFPINDHGDRYAAKTFKKNGMRTFSTQKESTTFTFQSDGCTINFTVFPQINTSNLNHVPKNYLAYDDEGNEYQINFKKISSLKPGPYKIKISVEVNGLTPVLEAEVFQ